MDFVCLILFLVFYFFRPQEWIGFLNTLHPVQLFTVLAVFALFTRPKGLKPGDLFKTPHDTLVFAYFAWTVLASPTPWSTFLSIPSHILFYIIGVQSLSSIPRIKTFLGWWGLSLLAISGLAVASQCGFDPFGSNDLTNFHMKGRLCLNLSIYCNPNALGHTIVPVIPMVYFLFFWKNLVGKLSALLYIIPLWCLYLTQSKGAILAAFATICTTLTFGRPKLVQIAILAAAGIFGVGALYTLPRMNELQKSTKGNEAIGGRIAAFTFGYQCMKTRPLGIGLGNFERKFLEEGPMERIPSKRVVNGYMRKIWVWRHYSKASHSAYNQNGAELGYTGFILFIGILYSCLRTLITMPQGNVDQERVRRALFAIVISYAVSSWMVDFAFRPTFFLFVAATGALHRINLNWKKEQEVEPSETASSSPSPFRLKNPTPKPALAAAGHALASTSANSMDFPEGGHWAAIKWTRLGLLDLALVALLTFAAVQFWLYSIRTY